MTNDKKAKPIWADISLWEAHWKPEHIDTLRNLGKAADVSSMSFRGMSRSFEEVATVLEKERLELMKEIPLPKCPVCGSDMRLVEPKESDRWEHFFGCSRYRDGCRGSRNVEFLRANNKYEAETEDVVAL